MATRLDAVQLAVPRAITDAQQQQHAAQRQPIAAQEHVAAQVKQNARMREQRPDAPERAEGGRVRNELLPPVEAERDPNTPGGRRGGRRGPAGQPRRQAPGGPPPAGAGTPTSAPEGDERGHLVDLRL